MRSVDNWTKAGQFCRQYVSNRKFDVIKKMAANTAIGVRRRDRHLTTHNDITQTGWTIREKCRSVSDSM